MSINRLPSLNALRAFTVAANHLNMRAAADELFVTPSALSHQIRVLEDQLGIKLFERTSQGLKLTDAGAKLQPQLAAAFSQISDAMASLKPQQKAGALTVSMLSTFAMRWFIPRLYRFQQQHPDIEIRITTSIQLVDFNSEDVDCAIRSGQGEWAGTHALRLFDERFTPVCSPKLPDSEIPLQKPADLANHTLLHSKLRPDDWRIWLAAADLPDLKPAHELEFETRNFAIAAAIRGLGVAIIDPLLVEEELKDKRLMQPFAQTMPTTSAYHLVWPMSRPESEELKAFREWLLTETEQ